MPVLFCWECGGNQSVAYIGEPPARSQNSAEGLAEEDGAGGGLVVLAHLSEVLLTPTFKGELVDLFPVSIYSSVFFLLPLHKVHLQVLPDPVHSVALLLGVFSVQWQRDTETGNPEPDVTQPSPALKFNQ